MFSRKSQKNSCKTAADQERENSSSNERKPDSGVPDTKTRKKNSWWKRLFGQLMQSSTKTKEEKKEVEKKKRKKRKFCGRLLQCFKKNRISPEPLVEDRAVEKDCSTTRADTEKAEERMEDTQSRVQGRLGFPNPGQICYMNASLQSLLTLPGFIEDLSSQEDLWSLCPQGQLLSRLMTIVKRHDSANILAKLSATLKLKKVLSIQAPEFMDHQQKDAHEFLTAILDQVASLAGPLEERARFLGMSYTCPVKNNMQFLMKLSRTCRRCLTGSTREETFTNLSLNPVEYFTVEDMLQHYQKEEDLDYACVCGGKTSSQQSTFLTLPKILILHLKRFKYTPSLQLKKVLDPVRLQMNVKVSTHQAQNSYTLVSILSHLGRNVDWGHYISDGVDLTGGLDSSSGKWLTYDDRIVTKTTGSTVCSTREQSSYILFYMNTL